MMIAVHRVSMMIAAHRASAFLSNHELSRITNAHAAAELVSTNHSGYCLPNTFGPTGAAPIIRSCRYRVLPPIVVNTLAQSRWRPLQAIQPSSESFNTRSQSICINFLANS